MKNVHEATVAGFGDEWSRFTQDGVEKDAEPVWLNVACAEGTSRMPFRQ